ncbi:hypothetical protein BGW39_006923 [Mortierella sp. 14UC]|nr:hypothetical protein BGW39_006923 [Mortierella sp. 14UC]
MSDLSLNYRRQQALSSSRIILDQNGELVTGSNGASLDHSSVNSRCDHNLDADSDSGVDMVVVDRNGNPAASNHHRQHHNHENEQVRQGSSGGLTEQEMRLRGEIMARISPRATMMSRTPPTLPEVPVWNEPVAHQIRRVQSAHIAELHRQWEDQQQQRRQAQEQHQQQQDNHQHQRHSSYPPMRRSASMPRNVPVAMERTPAVVQYTMPSSSSAGAGAESQLARGSNSLYLNYEGGALRPEESWRRGGDDMVGR